MHCPTCQSLRGTCRPVKSLRLPLKPNVWGASTVLRHRILASSVVYPCSFPVTSRSPARENEPAVSLIESFGNTLSRAPSAMRQMSSMPSALIAICSLSRDSAVMPVGSGSCCRLRPGKPAGSSARCHPPEKYSSCDLPTKLKVISAAKLRHSFPLAIGALPQTEHKTPATREKAFIWAHSDIGTPTVRRANERLHQSVRGDVPHPDAAAAFVNSTCVQPRCHGAKCHRVDGTTVCVDCLKYLLRSPLDDARTELPSPGKARAACIKGD